MTVPAKPLSLVALALLALSRTGADALAFGTPRSVTRVTEPLKMGPTLFPISTANAEDSGVTQVASMASLVPRGGSTTAKAAKTAFDLGTSRFPALTGGMLVLAAAVSPYALSLFWKRFSKALLVYKTETSEDRLKAYEQQAYWVFMYATLGLCLTAFQFFHVYYLGVTSAEKVLKRSFWVWSMFYTGATIKVRYEDTKLDMLKSGRFFTQAWHIFVTLAMWGAIWKSELFINVMDGIIDLFSFGK